LNTGFALISLLSQRLIRLRLMDEREAKPYKC
jgi:hypothetical protein